MKSASTGPVLFILAVGCGLAAFLAWGEAWAVFSLIGSGVALVAAMYFHQEDGGREGSTDTSESVRVARELRKRNEVESEPARGHIMILQNHERSQLDALAPHIERDERALRVKPDEGRYYSVPDGDDLAAWFTLHVTCAAEDEDALMSDVAEMAQTLFGADCHLDFKTL